MMDQRQRELRHAARQEFMESLKQLHESLRTTSGHPEKNSQMKAEASSTFHFDLNVFEQAVADIEEFIEGQKKSREDYQGSGFGDQVPGDDR